MAPETRAWTYSSRGYPDALQQTNITLNDAPLGRTEILVRVKAAALNPVDIQLMNYPLLRVIPSFLVPVKGVGEDFAGTVEQAGPASGFKPADEVLGIIFPFPDGTLQERIRVDTAKSGNSVVLKPHGWTWEQAAALPLAWLTARTLIDRVAPFVDGAGRVAVLGGSSATGLCAVYLAKRRDWEVVASCSAAKAELVRGMGADEIVDYRTVRVSDELAELRPDAIMDCVGGTECIGLAKRYVTIVGDKTSRLSLGGAASYLLHPRMIWRSLLGTIGLGPSYTCINLETRQHWLEEILDLPQDKIIIDSVYPFQDVLKACERLVSGRASGKLVISID